MQDTELVRYIMRCDGVAPSELAQHLGVKERAMRDRIRHANDSMHDRGIIVYDRTRQRYVVDVLDEEGLDAWVAGSVARDAFDRLPSTPDERVAYLLQDLLSRTGWITLADLASLLFVSRSTISSDLRRVERTLDEFHLRIEKRARHGIRVVGSEIDRRLCLASIAVEARLVDDELGEADYHAMLDTVERCVTEVLDREQYKINPVSHQNLVVHIAIAIARIRKNCYVPMDATNFKHVSDSAEYAVAGAVARAIERAFSIELPEEEVAYIAIHLASKHLIEGDGPSGEADGGNLEITDEAWSLAAEMLDVVWRAFRFDFRDDVELRMSLARHLMPLEVRLKYGMAYDNPLLPDIKARYPLPFSMAIDALGVLGERYGTTVSDAETGYVALFFALALESRRTGHARKHVLVVCASGAGSARLLAYRLQEEFSSDFESVEACDASDFATRDLDEIDYIFTTVPLERVVEQPVVHISLFLDETSRRDVKRALKQDSDANIKSYFTADLFFAHCSFTSHEEIIDFLCERCADYGELPGNFKELVWQRERAANTSFGNLVALPHPYEAVSAKTFVAVVLTDSPVDWGGVPVQAVFMVCVARDAGADLEAFYHAMTGLLTRQQSIQALIDDMRFEVLLSELEGE